MLGRDEHVSEEALESYALGTLPALPAERLETHLLICAACQDRLAKTDIYVQAVRDAALRLSHEHPGTWRRRLAGLLDALIAPQLVWVAGAVLLAAALALMSLAGHTFKPGATAPVAVALKTLRGGSGGYQAAEAPSGRQLLLEADLAGLPRHDAWELRLVDSTGRQVRSLRAEPEGGRLAVAVPRGLSKGAYWARLYPRDAPDQLLREYALRVN